MCLAFFDNLYFSIVKWFCSWIGYHVPLNIRIWLAVASYSMQLNVPKTKHKEFGATTFSVFGPKTWNQLPIDLRTICRYDTLNVNITLKHIILK